MIMTRSAVRSQAAGTVAVPIPSIKKSRKAARQARDSEQVRTATIQRNCFAARQAQSAAADAIYLGMMRYMGKPLGKHNSFM
jgi:hypothetical protein